MKSVYWYIKAFQITFSGENNFSYNLKCKNSSLHERRLNIWVFQIIGLKKIIYIKPNNLIFGREKQKKWTFESKINQL